MSSIKTCENTGITNPGNTRHRPIATKANIDVYCPLSRLFTKLSNVLFCLIFSNFSVISNVKTIPVKQSSISSNVSFLLPIAGSLIYANFPFTPSHTTK